MPALSISTKFKAIDAMSPAMTKMSKSATALGNSATKAFTRVQRAGNKVNKTFSGIGGGMAAMAGGFAVASAVQAGAASFVDFEKSISAAGAKFAVFDMEGKQANETMSLLRKTAADVGATTTFSAGQAAQGLNFLAMSGFSVKDSVAALPTVVDLATAAEVDLATASDIATDSLGAMGKGFESTMTKGKKLAKISDMMAKTSVRANTTLPLLFESINEAGAVFTAAGGKMHDFSAIIGTMANSGIKGSKAGTALKNMMVRLQAPTPKVSAALSSMGVNIDDGTGKMKKMTTILGEMITSTNSWTDIQRNAAFATIFGKEALAGVTVTANEGAKSIDAFAASLKDSDGISKRMSKFMSEGLSGVIASMHSAFESIAIAIGSTFKNEIDSTIKSLTNIAKTAKTWISENKAMIKFAFTVAVFIAKIAIAIKVATIAFAAYQKALIVAKKAQEAFNFVASLNPISLIIISIVALIALITVIVKKWKTFGAAISIILGPLGLVISLIQSFRKNWEMITEAFKSGGIIEGFKAIGKTILDAVLYPLQQLFKLMSNLPGIGDTFGGFSDKIKGFRAEMGIAVNSDTPSVVNSEATKQKALIERSETTENQRLAIDINDRSGLANVVENTGMNVNLSSTLSD